MGRTIANTIGDYPAALDSISYQTRVRDFLGVAALNNKISHAYLFLGPQGCGMEEAARALSQIIVCPHGGCAKCDECIRVAHSTHPDVKIIEPSSVKGYLIDQVREVIADCQLTPVRAKRKVYIFTRADLLRGTGANALLKTIEEPPEGVVFIFMARTQASVLSTIVSRCQIVPFRTLSTNVALKEVELKTGVSGVDAKVALAVVKTPQRAVEYVMSSEALALRMKVVRILNDISLYDTWDTMVAAHGLIELINVPMDSAYAAQADGKQNLSEEELEEAHEREEQIRQDFLSAAARKELEKRDKRLLTAKQHRAVMDTLACFDTLLRDALLYQQGSSELCVHEDVLDVIGRLASQSTLPAIIAAIDAVKKCAQDISHNVTPQLAIEVMLLNIKEALCLS